MKQSKPKNATSLAKRVKPRASESSSAVAATVTQVALVPSANHAVHAFGASCTIRDSAALKATLDALFAVSEVTFDVSAIERIDTAALQLLAAFVRDRKTQARTVHWRGSAAHFYDAVNISGLGVTLDLSNCEIVGATT